MSLKHILSITHLSITLGLAQSGFGATYGQSPPSGEISSPGWALARLNHGSGSQDHSPFNYPESTQRVRLYLIDTAVDNSGGWFNANENLTLQPSILIRGALDPITSSAFTHGTQMLSIIAGPEAGAAIGTPIEVISYDIYPQGEGSTSSSALLATALSEIQLHMLLNPGVPAAVCIANGSAKAASSPAIGNYVTNIVLMGAPVIISAGNSGADAVSYVPANLGINSGVITVGASDQQNKRIPTSNFGEAVDLYAPGKGVRTFHPGNPSIGQNTLADGTSPAAALATAAVLSHLSRDPSLTPAEIESMLEDTSYQASLPILQLSEDFDKDGTADTLEVFHGTDPGDASDSPKPLSVQKNGEDLKIVLGVNSEYYDASNPSVLKNGMRWRIQYCSQMTHWKDLIGSVSTGESSNGMTTITLSDLCVDDGSTNGYLVSTTGDTTLSLSENEEGEIVVTYAESGETSTLQTISTGSRCFFRLIVDVMPPLLPAR